MFFNELAVFICFMYIGQGIKNNTYYLKITFVIQTLYIFDKKKTTT